jgi:hypothetical protein
LFRSLDPLTFLIPGLVYITASASLAKVFADAGGLLQLYAYVEQHFGALVKAFLRQTVITLLGAFAS